LILGLFTAAAGVSLSSDSNAGDTVHVLILKEHGIGSSASAQPYVDKLVDVAAKANGWSSAKGKLVTRRSRAEKYIKDSKPAFGMISLGAFVAMKKAHSLGVLGTVDVKNGGGRQYFLISKSGSALGDCKGAKLASNHADDKKFIDKVVSGGDFKLSDFNLSKTKRPVQTLKKVIKGDAKCALIDDAQKSEMGHVDGGRSLKVVWSSKQLPAMPVVAFSSASAADRAKFKSSLSSLCSGAGKASCDKVGIVSMKSADESAFKKVLADYGD
jgi:hypothetical protein